MSWEMVKLGNLSTIVRGSSPRPQGDKRYYGGTVPRLMIEDLTRDGKYVIPQVDSLTEEGAKLSRPMKKGELVITVSGRTGVPAILNVDACIHDGFVGFRELSNTVDIDYLYHYLSSLTAITSQQAVGAIFKNLTTEQLKNLEIPLPPLSTQQRIAEILDKADALRRKDQALLKKYDELVQAIFMDMFGDPVKNEMGWERKTLRGIALKISDGPFGSNLKTEHYKKEGIRVIRLANIGVNEFMDKGAAFISEEHYQNVLKKHTCLVGDILIATLGEPNPRACEFPAYLEKAVNKADCIMLRINDKICIQSFVSHLINIPSMIESAQSQMHGQTRTRISMSQVAELLIPVPPLELQKEYANAVKVIEEQRSIFSKTLNHSESLFQSLLQQAFKGELV